MKRSDGCSKSALVGGVPMQKLKALVGVVFGGHNITGSPDKGSARENFVDISRMTSKY